MHNDKDFLGKDFEAWMVECSRKCKAQSKGGGGVKSTFTDIIQNKNVGPSLKHKKKNA